MTADRVTVRLADRPLADVSPYLFSALTEHFGRGIYGGIWDQERDVARADVRAAVQAHGYTMFRYPGGCFSDWYHWRDGVGPKAERPTHPTQFWTALDLGDFPPTPLGERLGENAGAAFGPPETNAFGTDEFLQYCLDTGVEPLLVANFGTGDPEEAAAWVRYTNVERSSPRPVRHWGIGNEVYGSWELGSCSAEEYATRFREFSRAMRAVDPDIELVAVGLVGTAAEADEWNRTVVEIAGDDIDALSLHWYFPGPWIGRPLRDDEGDHLQLAAAPDALGRMIDSVTRCVDAAAGPGRKISIALDEWSIWATIDDWLEANARLADGVFFAGCYNRMIERADRVSMAMISHLVNCMGPIQTRGDRHFVTASYLIGSLYRHAFRREAVPVELECDTFAVPDFADTPTADPHVAVFAEGEVSSGLARVADASATRDEHGATVFLCNRVLDRALEFEVSGLPAGSRARFRYLGGPDPFAANDVDHPDTLGFRELPVEVTSAGTCTLSIPPATAGALIADA
ncbi:MAG TPA: alpha-L-arabinofuranosidase C-terminal domain-containing protein [Gaiellaceae bacterium]|nr:alpha-L-arabinofuranosidase C-terminal domain-containing protein [Gaiellaceae bacterium]